MKGLNKCDMISNPLVSVIVPVYNTENYIEKCVDSIIAQTYKDFELILIDDGSIDNSPQICDKYLKLDNRVKVIHKANGGLSSARNAGIEIAQGKYITFIDSDDFIIDTYLDVMIKLAIENDADVVQCAFDLGEDGVFSATRYKHYVKVYTGSQALTTPLLKVLACCKLYKIALFDEIKFSTYEKYEDDATYYKLIYNANKVVITSEKLYYYLQRMGSLIREFSNYLNIDFIKIYEERIEFFKEKNEALLLDKSIERFCAVLLTFYIKCKKDPNNINDLKQIFEYFCKQHSTLRHKKSVPLNRKIIFMIFKIVPNLSSYLVLKLKLRYKYYNISGAK